MYSYDYLGLDSDYTYQEYGVPTFTPSIVSVEGGSVVLTINGASGPNINIVFSNGLVATGGASGTINVTGIINVAGGGTGAGTAAGARSNLGAAKSGVNDDITMFTALAAVGGFGAWTGTSTKTGQATYSATADALYNQAQIQALMDKVQQLTEFVKALVDAHHGSGVLET